MGTNFTKRERRLGSLSPQELRRLKREEELKKQKIEKAKEVYKAVPKPNKRQYRLTTTEMMNLLESHLDGDSHYSIAKRFNVSINFVKNHVSKHKQVLAKILKANEIKGLKPQILETAVLELINAVLNKSSDKKASINALAYAAKQLHDIQRLENGLSTANVGLAVKYTSPPASIEDVPSEDDNKDAMGEDIG